MIGEEENLSGYKELSLNFFSLLNMKFFLFISFFICSSFLHAQNSTRDVVYLKSGTILKGKIVEEVPLVSYTIRTADSSIFVVKLEEILKIVHEELAPAAKKAGNAYPLAKGYECLAELGFGGATGLYGLNVSKFTVVNAYRINKFMAAGLGIGFKYFTTDNSGFSVIPVFLDFRYKPFDKPISPYVGMSAGYGWDASHGFHDAGFMYNPQIGLQLNTNKDFMLHLGVGYDIQQMRFATSWNSYVIRYSEAVSVNLGLVF